MQCLRIFILYLIRKFVAESDRHACAAEQKLRQIVHLHFFLKKELDFVDQVVRLFSSNNDKKRK